MAAILCEGVGKMCSALCKGIGKVLCLPCKLCGVTTEAICKVVSGDFSCFLISTVTFNALPFYFGGLAFTNAKAGNCSEKQWLIVDLALSAGNIIAAFYIAKQIQDLNLPPAEFDGGGTSPSSSPSPLGGNTAIPVAHAEVISDESANAYSPPSSTKLSKEADMEADKKSSKLMRLLFQTTRSRNNHREPPPPPPSSSNPNPRGSSAATATNSSSSAGSISRIKEVMCYDPWVAFYLLAFMAYSVWQFYGFFKVSTGLGNQCVFVEKQVFSSSLCGFAFLLVAPSMFFCALCCTSSRHGFRRR